MTSQRYISSRRLLTLIVSLSSVLGYSTTSGSNGSFVRPFGIEDLSSNPLIRFPENPKPKDQSPTRLKKKQSYDLGIGKNPPVSTMTSRRNEKRMPTFTGKTIEETVMYWSEHEAVREYPSPLLKSPTSTISSTRPELPKVQFERRSQDSLKIEPYPFLSSNQKYRSKSEVSIQDHTSFPYQRGKSLSLCSSRTPSTTKCSNGEAPAGAPSFHARPTSDSTQLDVNTVWVEMMIHSQRQEIIQATK